MAILTNSDHNGLILQWTWKLPENQARLKPRQIILYVHADFERANDVLSSVDWDQMIDSTNVSQSLLHWEQCFINVMVSCVSKGMLPKRKKQFFGSQRAYLVQCRGTTTCISCMGLHSSGTCSKL